MAGKLKMLILKREEEEQENDTMDADIADEFETLRGRLEWTEEHMKALETETQQLREENERLREALIDSRALAEVAYENSNRGLLGQLLRW